MRGRLGSKANVCFFAARVALVSDVLGIGDRCGRSTFAPGRIPRANCQGFELMSELRCVVVALIALHCLKRSCM